MVHGDKRSQKTNAQAHIVYQQMTWGWQFPLRKRWPQALHRNRKCRGHRHPGHPKVEPMPFLRHHIIYIQNTKFEFRQSRMQVYRDSIEIVVQYELHGFQPAQLASGAYRPSLHNELYSFRIPSLQTGVVSLYKEGATTPPGVLQPRSSDNKSIKKRCRSYARQIKSCWTQLRSPTFGNQESMLIHMAINFESWLRWSRRIHGTSTTTCPCTNSRGKLHPRRQASDGQWPICMCCMRTSIAVRCASNRLPRWMKCTWMPLSWCTMHRATKWSPFLLQIWLPTKPPTGIEDGALQSYVGLLREVLVRRQRRLMKLKLIQKGRHPCLPKSFFLSSKKSSSSLIEVIWMLSWNFRKGSLAYLGSKGGLCFFLGFLMLAFTLQFQFHSIRGWRIRNHSNAQMRSFMKKPWRIRFWSLQSFQETKRRCVVWMKSDRAPTSRSYVAMSLRALVGHAMLANKCKRFLPRSCSNVTAMLARQMQVVSEQDHVARWLRC